MRLCIDETKRVFTQIEQTEPNSTKWNIAKYLSTTMKKTWVPDDIQGFIFYMVDIVDDLNAGKSDKEKEENEKAWGEIIQTIGMSGKCGK